MLSGPRGGAEIRDHGKTLAGLLEIQQSLPNGADCGFDCLCDMLSLSGGMTNAPWVNCVGMACPFQLNGPTRGRVDLCQIIPSR
jgi:hypothetical protein